MASLCSEVKETKDRLAEFEESSGREDDQGDDVEVQVKVVASGKSVQPQSSYVLPSEVLKSSRPPSLEVPYSTNVGDWNIHPKHMIIDVPGPSTSLVPVNVPTSAHASPAPPDMSSTSQPAA
jgi:hypothetical protein